MNTFLRVKSRVLVLCRWWAPRLCFNPWNLIFLHKGTSTSQPSCERCEHERRCFRLNMSDELGNAISTSAYSLSILLPGPPHLSCCRVSIHTRSGP